MMVSTAISNHKLSQDDVHEWASYGPPVYEKPSSQEQIAALKDRKEKRTKAKQRLYKAFLQTTQTTNETLSSTGVTGEPAAADDDDANAANAPAVFSMRLLEQELDRLATRLVWEAENNSQNQHFEDDDNNCNNNKNNNGQTIADSKSSLSSSRTTSPSSDTSSRKDQNVVDYRPQGGPLLKYLWAPKDDPICGQSMYLGGEVGSDGNIYCIPGHASRVLQINTLEDTIQPIGPVLTTSKLNGCRRLYKWLRGIVVGDIIYGLPCHADQILRIDVRTKQITKIDIPYEEYYQEAAVARSERDRIWKYHGGSICPLDNCIYAIPQAATHVLKFDPTTERVSFVGPPLPGKCKWYGGIVGKQDGAIYGVPQNAAGVLRITPKAVTIHGDFGTNNHKWHGGAAAHNGVIVGVPANADTVLLITPASTMDGEPTLAEIGDGRTTIQSGRHRTDGKYKYLGAMAGTNGKVYIFPCASEYVLQVDTVHRIAKNVGPNLRDTGMELVHQNKWQNGLTCPQDTCVYGMPQAGHTLLRIDCKPTTLDADSPDPLVTTWKLPAPRIECRDKFEGGVITDSGIMYTVPNNHKGVLRIEPPEIAGNSK